MNKAHGQTALEIFSSSGGAWLWLGWSVMGSGQVTNDTFLERLGRAGVDFDFGFNLKSAFPSSLSSRLVLSGLWTFSEVNSRYQNQVDA